MKISKELILNVVAERFEKKKLEAVILFGSFGTELFNEKSDIDIIIIDELTPPRKIYFFKEDLGFDCQLFRLDDLKKLLNNKHTRTHWIESMSSATILHDVTGNATKLIEETKILHVASSAISYEKAIMAAQTVRCRFRKILSQDNKNYLYFSALNDLMDGMYIITCFNYSLKYYVHSPLRNHQIEVNRDKFNWLHRIISNSEVFDSHKLLLEEEVNKVLLTVCDDGV